LVLRVQTVRDTKYQGYRVTKIQNNRDIYLNSRDGEFKEIELQR
jgi:hypothetical protein